MLVRVAAVSGSVFVAGLLLVILLAVCNSAYQYCISRKLDVIEKYQRLANGVPHVKIG